MKDNTEAKILLAAQKVFVEKGMDGARMQEIANEAGINKALLHYYFRTKQKLFEAIFKMVFSKIFPNLMELVNADRPIEEKIATFIEKYIDLLQNHAFLPTFVLKEMNRDPKFMATIIKDSGINPAEIFAMFEREMDQGIIRRMDPRDLLINILSLSIFPFAAHPLFNIVLFDGDKKAYAQFLEARKASIKEFVLNAILMKQ